jgi:hypothetical protein
MHLYQPLYQRQADTQTTMDTLQRHIDLGEQLEDAVNLVGGDADPGGDWPYPGKSTARQRKRLLLSSDTSGDIAYQELDHPCTSSTTGWWAAPSSRT